MKVSDFISKCKQAGVEYKTVKGGKHCLMHANGSVSFSKSTKQLDGKVVKAYIKILNLHELEGVGTDEFKDGTSDEREQIYRYMATLKRLAKT